MLVIVDYGAGNLGSLVNMCKHVGIEAKVSASPEDILTAKHIILPGVGAFDHGMKKLNESGLVEALNKAVLELNTPVLGICLGMQLMTLSSEEGTLPGLGWINAKTVKIPVVDDIKVPHMGWSLINYQKQEAINQDPLPNERYYFVHSYCVQCLDADDRLAQVTYGTDFDVMFQKGNIIGAQFHPEKSHKFGKKLLKSFAQL
ncbi:imidazole glycerol phosphate synthase subunit HisH [Pseudoalteromonas sp. SMS1]|uniref:imidazole glycerol phosphate synthase subunit HisH n=1 Tax=Pseudoalteromonas sp. SMS1 TaxID=2908894 RepID=UPI001F393B85|nr:imidazole glycerol phosphate synthase subunit HisH [Pseudoalteromonas sp. SMS1]MCF2857413.1 imidazole glycerol phosphate synthase subunit HisH [Pseudoalteromonas sp. SMS1]